MGRLSRLMEGDSVITGVLTRGRQEGSDREVIMEAEMTDTGREGYENGKQLALKVEEEALSQGIQAASRSGERTKQIQS